ncbi:ATP-dependent RNA helicase, putative [Theileria annulata]|uniref:ATP-dependent RNA helicase, putative n=1 Tax=Theileria annulata TaxID=5874 RepID=Q4UB05_THEAN|nr:ATP-dependent RNA helicase, putative [Theileria annulata]CAI75996.1 ATP-dependent RNA helicase, putative [Theileria annulata]|eukprot:XP_955472.1 ATP-dependent RNA helicase, putative [Theileria annulata]
MNQDVHIMLKFQIIAIFIICTIDCILLNKNPVHEGFITHQFGNNYKTFQIRDSVIVEPPFDPGGIIVETEHSRDLKNVFFFNVAHKLKEGRKLLESFTVPLSKQKLAMEHFKLYFNNNFSTKTKQLSEIVSDFEATKCEIKETVRRIEDVFVSEIENKFEYVENISDLEVLNRQVEILYGADLMASYILLFTSRLTRSVLYKYIWSNHAFLDSDKEYLCCNWIVNGGVHDTELHKKFSLDELTNEDLVDIIRLHKNYLTFVKVRSRKVLSTLDRKSLISIFQTILMKSIWAHYIHEPSNISIDKNKEVGEEKDEIANKNKDEMIDNETLKFEREEELEDEFEGKGHLDNIYNWIMKYKNRPNSDIKGLRYLENRESNKLKETINTLDSMLVKTKEKLSHLNKSLYNYYKRMRKRKIIQDSESQIKEEEVREGEELRFSLEVLINYYKDTLDGLSGLYGKIRKEENVKFLNNLIEYEKHDLLNLLLIYLPAIPELKQITDKQVYLNYLTLSKITLVKLVYIAMIRTSPVYVPFINHYYSLVDSGQTDIDNTKLLKEREEILKHSENTSASDDVLAFEFDEIDTVINKLSEVNPLTGKKVVNLRKVRLDNKSRQVVLFGTRRTEQVTKSILKHPPHFQIVLKLLSKNSYSNSAVKENLEYLEQNYGKQVQTHEKFDKNCPTGSSESEELKKIIRTKRLENLLSLLNENELNEIYSEFLKYIYPFNSVDKGEVGGYLEEVLDQRILGDELLGDENMEIVYNSDLLNEMKGNIKTENNVIEIMKRYLSLIKSRVYDTVKDSILTFLSQTIPDSDEKIKELSEKNDVEVINEFKEYLKDLEQDENTLRIEYNTAPQCKTTDSYFKRTKNMFNILPTKSKKYIEGARETKLYSTEEDITFIKQPFSEIDEIVDGVDESVFKREKEKPSIDDIYKMVFSRNITSAPKDRIEKLNFSENVIEKWTKLGLSKNVARSALSYLSNNYGNKFEQMAFKPSLIQKLAIEEVLNKNRKNLVISGSVGGGKTLAYLLPILQRLKEDELTNLREPSSPRCLIITPTTELCSEIHKVVKKLSHLLKITGLQVSKGVYSNIIRDKLKGLVDVVVATPSRLLKFRKLLNFNKLKYVVLEESDCLFNEGFFPLVYTILQQIPNYSHINNQKSAEAQIIQVASNISYLKFFESIHKSFTKFLNKSNAGTDPNQEEVERINLVKLFGKHKKRLELYKHIVSYYFKPLESETKTTNRSNVRNNMFDYNKRIIDELINSHKVVDEVGITRPSKGIKHMFIPVEKDKVRTLINILKYDIKYPATNNTVYGTSTVMDNTVDSTNSANSGDELKIPKKIIVFCRKVDAVRAIDHYLTESGFSPVSVHSKMPFEKRQANFKTFREANNAILVTTELMSRGLNLDVDTVILFDFPLNPNEYIRKSSILSHSPLLYTLFREKTSNYSQYTVYNDFIENSDQCDKYVVTGKQFVNCWDVPSDGISLSKLLIGDKRCIGLIDKKDRVLSEAIKRSLSIDYFPINRLSSRKKDYNQITGTLKYLTQAGGYFKFMNHLRNLEVKGTFDPEDMYKYLDEFRSIVKEQFVNSFKKVKLRRVKICKRRRELMRKLKMLKKWNKAIRLKQRIISEIDLKKRTKDYIYVNFTKDERSCPPMKNLKKVRFELLKLKLLKGSNSEKLLKRSLNQILKFINRLQIKLINHRRLVKDMTEDGESISDSEPTFKLIDIAKSDNSDKKVKRICSLI